MTWVRACDVDDVDPEDPACLRERELRAYGSAGGYVEAVRTLEMLDAARRSAQEGRVVVVA